MRRNETPSPTPGRHGAALLEALVALTILAIAGLAVAVGASEAARSIGRVRAADREMRAASALMEAVALWPRTDLDRHLGERAQGAWRMRVDRESPMLYVVTLVGAGGGRELLRTSLFRPEAPRATP